MSNLVGHLIFYPDDRDLSMHSVFPLNQGDNVIGASPYSDIPLKYPSISDNHCKIIVTDGEYSVEDLGGGVYRSTPENPRQKLRPNKEYDILPGKDFYIANKYRCIIELRAP